MEVPDVPNVNDASAVLQWVLGFLLLLLGGAAYVIRHLYSKLMEDRDHMAALVKEGSKQAGVLSEQLRATNQLQVEVKQELQRCHARNNGGGDE